MIHELHGGQPNGEMPEQTAQKPSKSRLSETLWAVGVIGMCAVLGTVVDSVVDTDLKKRADGPWFGKVTPEGAQEVVIGNRPVEAKCEDIGKSVRVDLRRDEKGNAVPVFECKPIESAK